MKIRRVVALFTGIIVFTGILTPQENTKHGWSIGGIPAISYDTDTGFLYGAILNAYDFGNGENYPDYNSSLYVELTRTTKGSGRNQVFYDVLDAFGKGYRVTTDVSYLTEAALDFYGFNGYEAGYNPDWTDDESADYRTRVFYKHDRKLLRTTLDVQKSLPIPNTLWFAGLGSYGITVGTVDVAKLNEGNSDNPLPDSTNTLFDEYVASGLISADDADGGRTSFLKVGGVYDTRDNEPNPMKGMWSEALIVLAGAETGTYSQLVLTHRQYFTLKARDLSLAYRIGFQGKLTGDIPYYMLPFVHSTYKTTDGWGGSKTLRGILRNRVVGDGVLYGNLEMRWKFARFTVLNQNFYLALNGFVDGGQVIQAHELPDTYSASSKAESMHIGYGGGFRIAMNENFIIAVDYGMAADEQDGASGLYIGLGYLF